MRRARLTLGWRWTCLAALALGACPSESSDASGDVRDDGDAPADVRPDGDTSEEIAGSVSPDSLPDSDDDAPGDAAAEVIAPSPVMRLHQLDVGQGDALIVELPCGAMLVDSGGEMTEASASQAGFDSDDALEAQVRSFFAGRPDLDATFDLVVLTHPHLDHTRGVGRLLAMVADGELAIRNVVTNGGESGSGGDAQRALHDWADAAGDVGRWYVLERKVEPGGLSNDIIDPFIGACADGIEAKVTALWGRIDDESPLAGAWDPEDRYNENNHSVVLRIDFGASSALLTGDLEEAGIAALIARFEGTGLLDVDVYKVGHHGSYNGTTPELVAAMSPRAAMISSGPADRIGEFTAWAFGHPRWRAVSDLLGDADSPGVSAARTAPIEALVATDYANGHGVFEDKPIAPAVYCTGWEGATVFALGADGSLELPP